jgi:hypothetical protein
MEMKNCNACHVLLPMSEFDIKRNLKVCTTCKNCLRIRRKTYNENKIKNTCPHGLYKYYCPTCKEIKKVIKNKTIDLSNESEKEQFVKILCTKLDEYYTSNNFIKITSDK